MAEELDRIVEAYGRALRDRAPIWITRYASGDTRGGIRGSTIGLARLD
ncbi:hypothetical protein [Thermoproteus uzoniensis]|nr:hypothetical protein [Thermoproteus uzoniensis]